MEAKLLFSYGAVVFLLVLVICLSGSWVLLGLANREVDRLAATTTMVISDAIDRVSFSGKYHVRLLVGDLARKHPVIAYIAVHDLSGVVFAHSDPSLIDTQPHDPATREAMRVLDGEVEIIQDLRVHGKRIEEIDVPFVGGYENELMGVVRVGISRVEADLALAKGISLIAAAGLFLVLISLAVMHRISLRVVAPVANMALTLQGIFDHAPIGVLIQGRGGRTLHANDAVAELLDAGPEHTQGRYVYDLTKAAGLDALARVTELVFETGRSLEQEIELIFDSGKRTVSIIEFPVVTDRSGRTSEVCAFLVDLSRTKALEEQLRRAIRMDAFGTLARGIAHDLNNMLTSIIGHADLAVADAPAESEQRESLMEVLKVADQGATLTDKLAAVGRDRIIDSIPLDLAETVAGLVPMLSRLLGERIRLEIVRSGEQPVEVEADPMQLEQVLFNLATNAKDAMPEGGALTISVWKAPADPPAQAKARGVLTVADTGVGMKNAVMERALEPFFSTKPQGESSGLGLSEAYGIVKQHGGEIELESRVGVGSSVRVFLPMVEQEEKRAERPSKETGPIVGGNETILLAEDAASVRQLLVKILERRGYGVVAVEDGAPAVAVFARERRGIDLVLLDVVMSGMSGREALEKIRRLDPDMPAILMSGYAHDVVRAQRPLEEGVDFLAKPVKTDELLRKVRHALDRVQGAPPRDGAAKPGQSPQPQ